MVTAVTTVYSEGKLNLNYNYVHISVLKEDQSFADMWASRLSKKMYLIGF